MTKAERDKTLMAKLDALPDKPVIQETEEERNRALFGPMAHTVRKLKRAEPQIDPKDLVRCANEWTLS